MAIDLSFLQKGRVLLLSGGRSAERPISLKSGLAVAAALESLGIAHDHMDPAEADIGALEADRYDVAFIALHGRGGEDGVIQGVLEFLGIPYTGSGILGSAVAMDKVISKKLFRASGVATAPFRHVMNVPGLELADAGRWLAELGGRIVIKPAHEGSSIGMAIVDDETALREKLADAFRYDSSVLLEAWLAGDEYTVAILGSDALPVIRLQVEGGFYDYHAKYQSNTTRYLIPSGLLVEREREVQALALQAFAAVGAAGWGRVDVMCDAEGRFQVLEVNTVPGMTDHSLVPKAAMAAGMDFKALVARILKLAAEKRSVQ